MYKTTNVSIKGTLCVFSTKSIYVSKCIIVTYRGTLSVSSTVIIYEQNRANIQGSSKRKGGK